MLSPCSTSASPIAPTDGRLKLLEAGQIEWPANVPAPVDLEFCHQVIAAYRNVVKPTPEVAVKLARLLLAKWPWLSATGQDLTVYVTDIATVFAAFSEDAARHCLDPLTSPDWPRDMPPHETVLRRHLRAFDDRRASAALAAQRLVMEAELRGNEARRDRQIREEQRAKRQEPGGMKTIADIVARLRVEP